MSLNTIGPNKRKQSRKLGSNCIGIWYQLARSGIPRIKILPCKSLIGNEAVNTTDEIRKQKPRPRQ